MSLYSVRLLDPRAVNRAWGIFIVKVRAKSSTAAGTKALAQSRSLYPGCLVLSTRELHGNPNYWRKIWRAAYANMPSLVSVSRTEEWVPLKPGTTPIAKYIKGEVKGTMRMRESIIERHVVRTKTQHFTKDMALGRLLGYARNDRHNTKLVGNLQVLRGLAFGTTPSAKVMIYSGRKSKPVSRASLLQMLAVNGRSFAKRLLDDRFK